MTWRVDKVEPLKRTGFPKLDESKIKLVYEWENWDGPLSGILEYEGKMYWFDFINACGECEEMGCDHENEGRHFFYGVKPITQELIDEVYSKKYPNRPNGYIGPNLDNIEQIGWFTDGCNQKFYAIEVHKKDCDFRENCDCIIIKKG